ncbi:MAG: class I SAM-dependent methyltransferase [Planctomycetales bacterium]|nr:class I SAM-dependent methyltransferase [Planctomycetales bacterium]
MTLNFQQVARMPLKNRPTAATCVLALAATLLMGGTRLAWGQDTPDVAAELAPSTPEPLTTYKGRTIAQTMHYRGAEWLIRENRESEERCSVMLANLGIKPGMTICDMGCGNGFYSLQMAKMVGPTGRVLAVDVQPQMLYMLRERMEKAGIENITPILGSFHNPRLPVNLVDLVLMVDVYHEFSHPEQMLAGIRDSLKPDGRIALLEYREEDPKVPIKPLHKMSKRQIMLEYEPNGFELVSEFEKLPWQHMMFFGKKPAARSGNTE